MNHGHTVESLRAFEAEIAAAFNAGSIRAPVHLDGGNEEPLIEVFAKIKERDWVFGGWRQHYHCLLKGVPPAALKAEILAGRSIALCFPEQRVFSSAIVAGICPIALGVALAIKRDGSDEHVWCFLGDMTFSTGSAGECVRYAGGHDLPITWIVAENGKSVTTDTRRVWGNKDDPGARLELYEYRPVYPHAGAGRRVQF